jgi:hypothetical protein
VTSRGKARCKLRYRQITPSPVEETSSSANPPFLPRGMLWSVWPCPGLLAHVRPTCRAFPSAQGGQWPVCGFRPDHSRGAAGDLHSLPLRQNHPKKIPGLTNQPGECPFYPQNCMPITSYRESYRAIFSGRSSGSRLNLINAPSHPVYIGTVAFLRFSSPVTAAGPLLILTGFP